MTNHLAVLEERLASLESALKHAGTLAPDDYGYRFVARCRKEAEALRAAIALMRGQSWQDIATAPAETEVLVYDQTQEPSVFSAKLTDGYEGPYWHPSEQLVADVMDSYLHPTHWRPLDAPTLPEGHSR